MGTHNAVMAFLTEFPQAMGSGQDAGTVVDQFLAPGFSYRNDGIVLDRDMLVAHARPARKNAVAVRVDVHETVVEGDRFAARYTLSAQMRKGAVLAYDVHVFGEMDPDGRVRRVEQITREVPVTAG